MKKSTLMVAALLAALAGTASAQAPAAAADPTVQMRTEERAAHSAYTDQKKALDKERNAKVKAAGDAAAAEAKSKGTDPAVARRDAEAKVKASTKADYDAKVKALKKEQSTAMAAIHKKYPAGTASPTPATPK